MDSKKIRKGVSRFLGWLGLNFCSLTVRRMPGFLIYGFAEVVARLGYLFAVRQRRTALESLAIAFGDEMTAAQRSRLARQCFSCMAKSGVEIMYLIDKPRLLEKRVGLVHREYLDAALRRGKGVILVSAHFGNFPLLLARLSLAGYKAAGIMRSMRDERAERIFSKKRQRYNIKTIYSQPRKECVEETIRSLRNNEVVFIPIDQNFGTGGVFVDFFGTKAATATGPAILALRTQAALVPCFIVRQADDTHRIIFEKQFDLEGADLRREGAVTDIIQQLTNIIERYIRQYPAEWGWIHKRWKSKPK